MAIYKRVERKDGIVRYMRDGLLVSEREVPINEMEDRDEFEFTIDPEAKKCFMCGSTKNHTRLVAGLMVDLCNFHYYSMSLGALTSAINKFNKEKENDKERRGKVTDRRKRKRSSLKG